MGQKYRETIEITDGIPDHLSHEDFDWESRRMSPRRLHKGLLISNFIGIDKTDHIGLELKEIRSVGILIDSYIGEIAAAALAETLVVLYVDHPVHSGRLKRTQRQSYVALALSSKKRSPS